MTAKKKPGVVGHEWALHEDNIEVGVTTHRCKWCGSIALSEDLAELDGEGCAYFVSQGADE
jgi:hypothetical protein